ncbi:hypothetical protein STAFG_4469 [Streptomyces afghaniensis 772]|uniref:Uncharacterized protein n=1 Tax=Streptomyces afghaniensis 772 TaxID=1283301 RepID=S4MP50_9ACTN|nr:hypothetical protein STAFG_4469 [Streptomyces afghaniensis 772]
MLASGHGDVPLRRLRGELSGSGREVPGRLRRCVPYAASPRAVPLRGPATYLGPPLLPCVSEWVRGVSGRWQDSASAGQARNVCESTCREQAPESHIERLTLVRGV